MYHPSASGSASSRSVSAVDDQHVPLPRPRLRAHLEEGQHLLGARDHRQLLGRHWVDARHVEDGEQVALDVGPRPLEAVLCIDMLHPQVGGHLTRLRGGGHVQRVGQRVCGVGGQHEGAVPGRGTGARGGGGEGRLPHAALAGEQQDPHARTARQSDSTRFLRPFSAASIRIFSPLRLSMPINGMVTSSASR
jgi:hypothetical protein